MMYKKKPVAVEAREFTHTNHTELAAWCGGFEWTERDAKHGWLYARITIPTLEGAVTARVGDWIIKGVKGEFYPCRGDIFAETYEPAE